MKKPPINRTLEHKGVLLRCGKRKQQIERKNLLVAVILALKSFTTPPRWVVRASPIVGGGGGIQQQQLPTNVDPISPQRSAFKSQPEHSIWAKVAAIDRPSSPESTTDFPVPVQGATVCCQSCTPAVHSGTNQWPKIEQ